MGKTPVKIKNAGENKSFMPYAWLNIYLFFHRLTFLISGMVIPRILANCGSFFAGDEGDE